MREVISFRGIRILREEDTIGRTSMIRYDGVACLTGREHLRKFVWDVKIMNRMVYTSPRVIVHRHKKLMSVQYKDTKSKDWRYVVAEWERNNKARRQTIARVLRAGRSTQVMESIKHLGWKHWRFDASKNVLISPFMLTPWYTAQLWAENFSPSTEVERKGGIHAYRMTRQRWIDRRPPCFDERYDVWGVIEIGGRYVLGTEGLRCEVATIKHLATCDPAVAAKLVVRYPGVCVHLVGG